LLPCRREDGPGRQLIPDFLIAGHADRLAAIDRGYLRRYFPNLALLPDPLTQASHKINNQDDQQDQTEGAATDDRPAEIKAAAAEQKKKDQNQDHKVHRKDSNIRF
jgi:hypothetical protein